MSLIFNILHTAKVMTFGIWCLQVVDRIHPFIDDGDTVCMECSILRFFALILRSGVCIVLGPLYFSYQNRHGT